MTSEIKKCIAQLNNGEVPDGYKRTEFGVFPCDWVTDNRLGDLFDFYGGLSKSREELGVEGHPYLHYGDLHRNPTTVASQIKYLDMPKYDCDINGNETFLMQDGDIAFLDASEDLEGTSRAVLIDNPNNKTFIAGLHIINGRSKNDRLQKWYKQYLTTPQYIKKQFQRLAVGFKVYGINKDTLPKIQVAFPKSKAEQAKIAEILMKWDEAIELYNQQIEKIKQYKSIFLIKIFPQEGKNVPEWRFKDFTDNWEQRKLDEVADIQKGQQLGKTEMSNVGTFYVLNGGVEPSGYTDQFNTPANTISISEGGNSCGYVSLNLERFWSGGHNYTLQNLKIDTIFLYQWLKRHEKEIMTLRVGSGLPNIQKSTLQNVNVAYSTTAEQRAIAEILIKLDNLITFHQCKVDLIKKQRNVLQHYLLNGIVRV